jgi:hypothetical protein
MPEFTDSVAAGFALRDGERREEPRISPDSETSSVFENFTIPSRGVVVAVLVSGILWTGIILGARALWLLFR